MRVRAHRARELLLLGGASGHSVGEDCLVARGGRGGACGAVGSCGPCRVFRAETLRDDGACFVEEGGVGGASSAFVITQSHNPTQKKRTHGEMPRDLEMGRASVEPGGRACGKPRSSSPSAAETRTSMPCVCIVYQRTAKMRHLRLCLNGLNLADTCWRNRPGGRIGLRALCLLLSCTSNDEVA